MSETKNLIMLITNEIKRFFTSFRMTIAKGSESHFTDFAKVSNINPQADRQTIHNGPIVQGIEQKFPKL